MVCRSLGFRGSVQKRALRSMYETRELPFRGLPKQIQDFASGLRLAPHLTIFYSRRRTSLIDQDRERPYR